MGDVLRQTFEVHEATMSVSTRPILTDPPLLATESIDTIRVGGTIFAAGKGGSASDALHFVTELGGRFEPDRSPNIVALPVTNPTKIHDVHPLCLHTPTPMIESELDAGTP